MSLWDFCQGLTDSCPEGCHSARVIYLIGASLCFSTPAAYPPAMDEQPIVTKSIRGCHAPVYMALQPIRRAACRVTTTSGGLLPHLFTIAPVTRKWLRLLFSVTLLCRHRQLTVREYGALCCPDFPLAAPELTSIGKRHKRPATTAKLRINFRKSLPVTVIYSIFTDKTISPP